MRERSYSLDFLRTFMMFLGVLIHGIQILQAKIYLLSDATNKKIFSTIIVSSGVFRMQLFFLLSGYFSMVLFEKYGVKKFGFDRLKRIGIPFLLSIFTVGLLTNLLQDILYSENRVEFARLTLPFIFQETVRLVSRPNHLWFLYYLSLFTGLFFLLNFIFDLVQARRNIFLVWLSKLNGTCLLLAASTPLLYFTHLMYVKNVGNDLPGASFWINEYCFFYFFYFYTLGWLLHKTNFNLSSLKQKAELKLAIAIALTILRGKLFALPQPLMVIACSLTTWCYVFGLIGCVQLYFDKKSHVLRYLADSSYWVYLVHFPLFLLLRLVFPENYSFYGFLSLLSFQFCLSLVTYHYLVRPTFLGQLLNGKKQRVNRMPELPSLMYSKQLKQIGSIRLVPRLKQRKKESVEL